MDKTKANIEIRRGSLKTQAVIGEEKLKKILDVLATGSDKEIVVSVEPVITRPRLRRKRRQLQYGGRPLATELVKTFLANKVKITKAGKMRTSDIITQMGMAHCGNSYSAVRQAAKELGFPIGREGRNHFIYFRRDALPSFSSPQPLEKLDSPSKPSVRRYVRTGLPSASVIGQKEYHRLWHLRNRERTLKRQRELYRRKMKKNNRTSLPLPSVVGMKKYKALWFQKNKRRLQKKYALLYRKNKKSMLKKQKEYYQRRKREKERVNGLFG